MQILGNGWRWALFMALIFAGRTVAIAGQDEAARVDGQADEQILLMREGGWCWYQDPRALIQNGKLLVGGVSGVNGDVKVSVYDLEAGQDLGVVVLHPRFQADDHNVPAFYARPDGSVLAMYAKHGNEPLHYYRISDTADYTQWGEEQVFDHGRWDPATGVTYMNLHYLSAEKRLYGFFRDGRTFNPFFITSTDHGRTWDERTHFIADEVDGRHRPYPRYTRKGPDAVGFCFTEAHPRDFGTSIYYAEYRDGRFFRVSGEPIKELVKDGPLLTSEADVVFRGSGEGGRGGLLSARESAWTCAIATDAEGRPHLGYTLYKSNSDNLFRMGFWDGERWVDREVAHAGKCLYERESSYTGLMALDPARPTSVYISSDVDPSTGKDSGGPHEIYHAEVGPQDDISTIDWTPITTGSSERNLRPMLVVGGGYKVLLWLHGPWSTYTDYRSDAVGRVLERP